MIESGIPSWFDSLSVLFVWFVMLARLMIESGVQGLPLLLLTRSPTFFFLAWLGLEDGSFLVDAGTRLVPLRQSFSEWFVQYQDPFFLQRWQVPSSPLAV